MNDYPDNELIQMVCENNDDAREMLYERYKFIVNYELKKYYVKGKQLGMDYDDFKQEAMLGFTNAIRNYVDQKDVKLNTFITLCVDRTLKKYLRDLESNKNKHYKEAISLDMDVQEGISLYDVLEVNDDDPQKKLIASEELNEILELAKKELSKSESEVFYLLCENYSIEKMSEKLNVSTKYIYNTLARIRKKLKKN